MRHWLALGVLIVGLFASSSSAHAQAAQAGSSYGVGRFGLGVTLGTPTGIIGKYRFDNVMAIDGVVGNGFYGGSHMYLRAAVLWQFNLGQWSSGALDLFLGVGPQIGVFYRSPWRDRDEGLWVGARGPIGLSWFFSKAPIDLFFEMSAGLWLIQAPWFDWGGAIGARFWFGR